MPDPRITIALADDHPIFREGLRKLISAHPQFEVVAEAANGADALDRVRELRPDILLLDVQMPSRGGLDTLAQLAAERLPTKVILLTAAIDRADIVRAVHLGARGVVMKDSASALLYKCIERVVAGEYWLNRETVSDLIGALQTSQVAQPAPADRLTKRERQIVAAVARGASNKDIAAQLAMSDQTVKNHLSNIFDKLGVSSRLELALYAVENALADTKSP